ncbi:MAG: invasion associated locus B family protein [Sedimenticola sp.]
MPRGHKVLSIVSILRILCSNEATPATIAFGEINFEYDDSRESAMARMKPTGTPTLHLLLALLLCLPAVATSAPKPGDRFGNWIYECETRDQKEVCAITQTITIKENQARVLKLTLGKLGKENRLVLAALLPLGIYLPAGVAGKVDGANQFPITLRTCTQHGCEAVIQVDDHLRWKMKAGKELIIGFVTRPGTGTFTIPVSLEGTTAGLDALDGK